MTNISYNLSGRIDPVLVDILRLVHQEAVLRGMLFFVASATARDIVPYGGVSGAAFLLCARAGCVARKRHRISRGS